MKRKNKVAFLKRHLGLDPKAVEKEALKGKGKDDFVKAALDDLRPMAKRNLKLLKKHGRIELPFWLSAKKVDCFVQSYFGKDALMGHGKNVLQHEIRAAKKHKMLRILGNEKQLKKVKHAVEKADSKKVEKIILSTLKENHSSRWKRIVMFAIGALSLGLMCYFTGGLPLIILTAIFVLVALREFQLFVGKIKHEAEEKSAPGRYDHYIPWMNIAFVAAGIITSVALIVFSVGTFGILPLAVGIVVATAWLGLNIYHRRCINQRRENYLDTLIEQKKISLSELAYLADYRKNFSKKMARKMLHHLSTNHRESMNKLYKKSSKKSPREKLRNAIDLHQKHLEAQHVKNFERSARKTLRFVQKNWQFFPEKKSA